MDRAHTYNGNGMIANMTRGIHTSLVSAGENVQTTAFEYDHLGRLGLATTSFAGTAGNQYSVSTSYNKAGGILDKVSTPNASAKVYAATSQDMNYNLIYTYSKSKPHQLEDVISSVGAPYAMAFSYNTSGSISEITDMTGSDNSSFYWGQEQWLCGVQNAQGIHHYVYDHAGERVMKSSITQTTVQLNDQTINTVSTLEPYTLYVNPYYVITAFSNVDRKSKHYYIGTQRVATDLGVEYWASLTPQESTGGRDNTTKVGTTSSDTSSPVQSLGYLDDLQRVLEQLSEGLEVGDVTMTSTPIESYYPELVQESAAAESTESETPLYSGSRILYWYHPDYVSNVDLVTDRTGEAYELFLYNAWGESLHHWTSSSSNMWSSPYRFNSKELDPETGMHYYGSRYYDAKFSAWLSVDPKAAEFPSYSPYNYCLNNPVRFIDPNGQAPEDPIGPGNYSASVNSRYIGFGLRHPVASLRIGFGVTKGATDISTNSTRFATRGEVLYGSIRGQRDEGSENGAFRHALWQATITSEFGSNTAKEAGNAHEDDPFTSLKVRSFKNLADADQTVDLLNNIIGRSIGEANKGASMDDLANLVLDEFKNNGLYVASKDKDGNWKISKTKLTTQKYEQLKVRFKELNENGRTNSEQKVIDEKAKKEAQSYTRGPIF